MPIKYPYTKRQASVDHWSPGFIFIHSRLSAKYTHGSINYKKTKLKPYITEIMCRGLVELIEPYVEGRCHRSLTRQHLIDTHLPIHKSKTHSGSEIVVSHLTGTPLYFTFFKNPSFGVSGRMDIVVKHPENFQYFYGMLRVVGAVTIPPSPHCTATRHRALQK